MLNTENTVHVPFIGYYFTSVLNRAGSVSIFQLRFGSVRFLVSSRRFRFFSVSVFVQHHDGRDTAYGFCNIRKNKRKQTLPAFTSLTINVCFSLLHEINHATLFNDNTMPK